jgi:hypothetical protein
VKINIGDVWKPVTGVQINVGDTWQPLAGAFVNIGDIWKPLYAGSFLGITIMAEVVTSEFDAALDDCLGAGIYDLRIDIPDFLDSPWLARSKVCVGRAVARGARVVWGVSQNHWNAMAGTNDSSVSTTTGPPGTLTDTAATGDLAWIVDGFIGSIVTCQGKQITVAHNTANTVTGTGAWSGGGNPGNEHPYGITIPGISEDNWPLFRQGILDAATWAQANGVYEFQIGNEEELHNDVAMPGDDGDATLRGYLKDVAADVQAIFTNGNVSYSTTGDYFMDKWHAIGRGTDIDILAFNVYQDQYTTYGVAGSIANALSWFGGTAHTYVTEFNVEGAGVAYYVNHSYGEADDSGADYAVEASGVSDLITILQGTGITRAFYFDYRGNKYGVRKNDGTYRTALWDVVRAVNG